MRGIKRDGQEGVSSQKDSLPQMLPAYVRAALLSHTKKKDLQLFAAGQVLLQIKLLEVLTKLSDRIPQLCLCSHTASLSQRDGSLTCLKHLSSQSQRKDSGLKEKQGVINSLGIHALV